MPANLPPQYYELEREFRHERDNREKLRLAQELLRIMPKHKGTDKLQADMKAKISKLKKLLDQGGSTQHGARQSAVPDHIDKEGAGQVILIGAPTSGKSSLVDVLTHAEPLVADYPFTTREPMAGMMQFETVQIQLIDTPPISLEAYENYLSGLIRNADLVAVVADLAAPKFVDDITFILELLEEKRIILRPESGEDPDNPALCIKKTIVLAHKEYEDEAGTKRARLEELFPGFVIVPTSIIDDSSLEDFKRAVYEALGVMRVYTKRLGQEPDFNDPIVLPLGSTVEHAAEHLHKDFAAKLKFAKVWGKGKFDGQRVHKEYELTDGDIVEFHI